MVKRQLSTGERRLKSVFETDDTAKCGIECIEKFFHFCPSSTYGSSGVCCADIASCEFYMVESLKTQQLLIQMFPQQ
jgi:hypothetical protein